MAGNILKKIAFLLLLAVILSAYPACADGPAASGGGAVLPDELRQTLEKGEPVLLFDARGKNDYDAGHLPGAKMPREENYYRELELFRQAVVKQPPNVREALESGTRDLARTIPIVTYCNAHCGLSKSLKLELEDLGFTHVRWLDGGIDAWREKGYPLEKK